MRDLTIEMLPLEELRPWAKNPRTHSKKQIRQIADSIRTFGFTNPVLIDNKNVILAGHGRVAGACVAPEEPGDPKDDALPDVSEGPRRCRLGDVWQLGAHRLICGDALDAATVGMLMDGEKARMVFTDPPYNVPIDGHVGGSGKIRHCEFEMASGR